MRNFTLFAVFLFIPLTAWAGPKDFKTGPTLEHFGPHASVDWATPLSEGTTFKIAFDAAKVSDEGGLNRTLESAARFINMHVAAGLSPDDIDIAVIVHGGAATDLLRPTAFVKRRGGETNPNAPLIKALSDQGVRLILCGQTARYRDIAADELLPEIELSLSAMTAHAQLQQDGYTLNPF